MFLFFFTHPPTTSIYTLSLHDALPIYNSPFPLTVVRGEGCRLWDADGHEYIDVLGEYTAGIYGHSHPVIRSEEHTSELQSLRHLVCRLLLEKKKTHIVRGIRVGLNRDK